MVSEVKDKVQEGTLDRLKYSQVDWKADVDIVETHSMMQVITKASIEATKAVVRSMTEVADMVE